MGMKLTAYMFTGNFLRKVNKYLYIDFLQSPVKEFFNNVKKVATIELEIGVKRFVKQPGFAFPWHKELYKK